MKKFAQHLRDKPHTFINKTISLLHEISGKTIVEIGTMRRELTHPLNIVQPCCNDGHSTILFANTKLKLYSVDINKKATEIAQKTIIKHGHRDTTTIINGDGIKFLKTFKEKIDLLFLDAWDVGTVDYDKKHKEAYLAAQDKLADKHLILIDDTDVDFINNEYIFVEDKIAGKGKILIPFLIELGYNIVFKGRQTLLRNYDE